MGVGVGDFRFAVLAAQGFRFGGASGFGLKV